MEQPHVFGTANPPPSLSEIAIKAQEIFHKNADTLIAGFLITHPDIDPADVQLVFVSNAGKMTLSIEPKELHVPETMSDAGYRVQHQLGAIGDGELEDAVQYARGWNACRQAMIDQAAAARPVDAIVTNLDSAL